MSTPAGMEFLKVIPATDFVSEDEKAYFLFERNMASPLDGERHRFQFIRVNRGDKFADYKRDLGQSIRYPCNETDFPLLWEHSVGEAKEMADWFREHLLTHPMENNSTFLADWDRYLERKEKRRKHG